MERVARVARRRLAPRFPEPAFAEVRYRIKSWKRLDYCIEDARAAIREVGADRTLLLGFSMGGAVSISARRRAVGGAACSASRRGSRSGCRSSRCAGSASTSSTARSTASCRGSPASVAGAARGAASSARARSASTGRYTLIPRRAARDRAARSLGPSGRRCPRAARLGARVVAALDAFRRSVLKPRAARAGARRAPSRPRRARAARAPRITHHETSNWPRSSPCRAEAGKAWWLLCQPSPKTSSATSQLLRASSRER